MSSSAPDASPDWTAAAAAVPSSPAGALLPERKASGAVVATMVLARFGWAFAIQVPLVASLALKAQSLVGPDQAVGALGAVTSVGAFVAFVANPVFGRLSDRTRGRFGRRRPWLVVGAVGLLLALLGIAFAPSVLMLGAAWIGAQVFANAYAAPHTATLSDQVPPVQRGFVSGLTGVLQNVAILAAAYTTQFFSQDQLMLALVPGVIGLILMVLFAFVLPDRQLTHRPAPEGGLKTVLKTFWVSPRQNPDFAWAWVSRFLMVLSTFMFTTFRLLYLQKELGLPTKQAAAVMATGVLFYTIALVASTFFAGWLSDRLKRRKVFIFASAIIFAIGMVVLSQAHSQEPFFIAEAILGLGFGAYVGVDLALVVDLLPNPEEAAKDLGVFNIALAVPQTLAPGLGAVLIGIGGGHNYTAMITAAAVIALMGALTILPVKKVR
ncbi:MFS transporter [Sinomonas cellulolyticus]|uniref:MFS transporter n=1 Tax=Sinomonas cellulolyticus TaxID=2801916 RepID=A0ABS1K8B9_9MICC|nr:MULTISPECIES: MFS transporter [Sinomonas]MBL0707142.1 MFS transporter [Sinomonas cellulolyticus]GHG54948.1 MFS transporter [Sinomonas sp. KCTC 49339]